MPTYTVVGYQWAGFTTYPTAISVEIDDDDAELDWFGGDTGTAQTATLGGTTYTIGGAGLLPSNIQDNDGGGGTLSEELLFMNLTGFGWVFVPMPGSVFTPGDAIQSWTTGTWSDTNGVPHADVMCFTNGTLMIAEHGDICIEDLMPNDLVLTKDHGLQPILWIATTPIETSRLICDIEIRPILIRKDALGPNSPNRDTRVSPQHRVLFEGWHAELYFGEPEILVPAKALVDIGLAERDDSLKPISYVHILLQEHEILTGDGVKSESLMPAETTQSYISEAQSREITKLLPQYLENEVGMTKSARPAVSVREAAVLG